MRNTAYLYVSEQKSRSDSFLVRFNTCLMCSNESFEENHRTLGSEYDLTSKTA